MRSALLRIRPRTFPVCASPSVSARRFLSTTSPRRAEEPSTSASPATPPPLTKEEKGKAKEVPEAKNDDLPLLQRPLGVNKKPETKTSRWETTRDKYLHKDQLLQERHHLAKEATRGYWSDLSRTKNHGGKTWIAPKVMIREDKALFFPDISGTPLAGTGEKVHTTDLLAGKVSIVSLLTTRVSEVQSAQFVEPTLAAHSSNPMFQHVQINLQDNRMKTFLISMFVSGIRKSVSPEYWPTYLVSSQHMEYLRDPLGINNKVVGYVYLVDPNLKIRWAACADPKEEEVAALQTCATVLLNRVSPPSSSEQAEKPLSPKTATV
ncbi:ATP10 protein-domain-containing protein [Epithele typhae]|uniref:ATP10 protein-domain-containing protein n=1 Tax=Epithele typhae TaxID=378194 RepID=UPI002007BC67|nr:ATP10 protein-domain-containing protein [Epithele typhae]KAH9941739.1 ATP10 protein-domain-containing protein [Epithele typhae]